MKTIALIFFNIIIINLASAQTKYSDSELNDMIKTYSFYIGQLSTINGVIEKYPSLKQDALTSLSLWNMKFKSSVDNIIYELKLDLGDKFTAFEKEFLVTMDQLDYSKITIDEAKYSISSLKERADGNMPSPFLETLLSHNPTFQKYPEKEILEGFVNDYYTKESPKSEGLNIKIKYPKSWKSENGDRPHVVKKFTSNNGHGLEALIIMIKKIDEALSVSELNMLLSEEGIKYQLPDNAKVISVKPGLNIEGLTATSVTFYQELPRLDINVGMISEWYLMFFEKYMISLMFTVGSISNDYGSIFKNYEINRKLFWLLANNFVILSKYE